MPTPRIVVVIAAFVVALAALAATAHGLFAVAVAAKVPPGLAWLYPLMTDGLALVAYLTAHQRRARAYAGSVVVFAAGMSGLAQAVYIAGGSKVDEVAPPLGFGVGAWPAVAGLVGAHIVYLLLKDDTTSDTASAGEDTPVDHQPDTSPPAEPLVETVIEHVNALADPPPAPPAPPAHRVLTLAQPHPDVVTARRLLRERVGRPTLCRELRIGDNSAKTLQKMSADAVTHDLLVEWQGREAAAEERRRA